MIFDIDGAEQSIGYSFKDKLLLRKCFTHSSFAHENKCEDNEKLEFFGDAVLEFIVTEYLVSEVDGDEGKLTLERANMVSKTPLINIVKKLKMGNYILFGKGMASDGGEEKLYSSLYEAVVAGIYIDGGITKAKDFVKRTLIAEYKKQVGKTKKKELDNKTKLQEYVQKKKIGSISYETLSKTGPDHNPEFKVALLLNGTVVAEGKGKSIKTAEQKVAGEGLKILIKDGTKS